jgi:hypothetical protein
MAACLEAAEIDGKITWGERAACYSIAFDPLAADVAEVSLSLTVDPSKVQFANEVYFFGDFSNGGDYLPLVVPPYGGYTSLQPVGGPGPESGYQSNPARPSVRRLRRYGCDI